jgi:hypothetical protein
MATKRRTFVIGLKKSQSAVIEIEATSLDDAKSHAFDLYDQESDALEWGEEVLDVEEVKMPKSLRR